MVLAKAPDVEREKYDRLWIVTLQLTPIFNRQAVLSCGMVFRTVGLTIRITNLPNFLRKYNTFTNNGCFPQFPYTLSPAYNMIDFWFPKLLEARIK